MAGKNAGDRIYAPGDPTITVFTSSGTWTKPNGVRAVRVRVVGSGGGSGGCSWTTGQANSGGGGSGGYAEAYILAANLLSSETVTIGAAGLAGTNTAGTGGTGGTCSFGSHCSATGGGGGTGMASTTGDQSAPGGIGGTGSGGDINIQGDDGGYVVMKGGLGPRDGFGGGNPLASQARQSSSAGGVNAGHSYGGGGAGIYVSAASAVGSAGATGVVIVESIY